MEIGSSWSFLLLAVRLVTKMPEAETALELLAKTGLKYRGLARGKGRGAWGNFRFESFAAIGKGPAKRFSKDCNFFYPPHTSISNN